MANRIPLIVNPGANQIQEFNESADSLLGAIPIGGIIMWSGSIATIPTNYALCNGSNGTPDLRNRFVIGANVDDSSVAKSNIETGTYSGSNIAKQSGGFKNAVLLSHSHTTTTTIEDDSGSAKDLTGSITHISETYDVSGTASGVFTKQSSGNSNVTGSSSNSPTAGVTFDAKHRHETDTKGTNVFNANSTTQTGCDANLPPYFALAYIMRTT